jgi:hypothetical protein
MADSGRFNVVGMADDQSTDSPPRWSRRWMAEAMADGDPGKVSPDVDWREVAGWS